MKICAIICEFNPFHNGHAYAIEQAKKLSGCDAVLCIMSGSFTQRGEACVLDKFTRAKHAVLGGADCVIELPAAFSVAPAEIFAQGAVKILSSIPSVEAIAFGCESPECDFLGGAEILNAVSEKFKAELNMRLDGGESFIKAYASAFTACGGSPEAVCKPNNILGLEYAKAVLKFKPNIKLVPIKRVGCGHSDGELGGQFSSAGAIRANAESGLLTQCMPPYSLADFVLDKARDKRFEAVIKYALAMADEQRLAGVDGCSEGLENRLKALADKPYGTILDEASGKRYTRSRIKRILTCNALGLFKDDCRKFLDGGLYVKPLAIKNAVKDGVLKALGTSAYPLIIRQRDLNKLDETARKCFDLDVKAAEILDIVNGGKTYNFTVETVE